MPRNYEQVNPVEYDNDSMVEKALESIEKMELDETQLRKLIDGINGIIEAKNTEHESDNLKELVEEDFAENEVKENLNPFGLPNEWSHTVSVESLERIRAALVSREFINSQTVDSLIKANLEKASEGYKKYRDGSFKVNVDLGGNDDELKHLKMTREEKLHYLEAKYPKGFKLMGTDQFAKWDIMVDYELWAMQHHSQTLITMQRRGGATAYEIASMILGVPYDDPILKNIGDREITNWLERNGILNK